MVGLGGLARKIFGSANDRRIRSYRPAVQAIGALEPEMQALSDEALAQRLADFRARNTAGVAETVED